MTSKSVKLAIPELYKKIEFLLDKNLNNIGLQKTLEGKLKKGSSFISKLKENMDKSTLALLCKVYPEIPYELWHVSTLNEFKKGLSDLKLVKLSADEFVQTKLPIAGLDFKARKTDRIFLQNWFNALQGFWDIFSYSAFYIDKSHIYYGFLEITQFR